MNDVLTKKQGQSLLQLARRTIAERLGVAGEAVVPEDSVLEIECGTFVTLKIDGQLRGCIGNLVGDESVAEGVRRNAINAAFRDHRFSPLTVDEFAQVDIELSVLSPPQKLEYSNGADLISKLRPGVDGVILKLGVAGATFLPQVWEQLPLPEMFLGRLCQKAGLDESAWRDSHPEIETYQVQSFKEEKG